MNDYLFYNTFTLVYIKVEADTISEARDKITKKYGSNSSYQYIVDMDNIVTLQ